MSSVSFDCKLMHVLNMKHTKEFVRRLGYDIVNYVVEKTNGNPPTSSDYHVRTLRLTVEYLLEKHQVEFMDMVENISMSQSICESFVRIADKLFMDRTYNWGRVASLYAFAACIADYCTKNHVGQDMTRKIGETVGNYVSDNLTDWIYTQGGWVSNLCTSPAQSFHNIELFTLVWSYAILCIIQQVV